MLDKTEGIILKTTKYAETSLIAKIFTKKFGLLSFILQGIRTAKNKKGNLIQPMNMLHMDIYLKEQRNLNRIREYSSVYIYKSLHNDFSKQSIAVFCIELVYKCIKEHEVNERLYDYLTFFLIDLDATDHAVENKPLFFLLETASILGFEPSMAKILDGHYFNLENGQFEHEYSSRDNCLDAHETDIFKKMIAVYYEKNDLKLNAPERKLMLDKLLLYFKWHISDFTDLRSPAVLREILK